jgi:hypothetical protein
MKTKKITADVDTNNLNSVKILEKFMPSEKEFFINPMIVLTEEIKY